MANKHKVLTDLLNLKVCSWNANGIRGKLHELRNFVAVNKLHILLVQETHLSSNQKISIPGMICHRSDRDDGFGGTAIFVNRSIQHHRLQLLTSAGLEGTGIQINTNKGPLNLYSIYIPPSRRISEADLDAVFAYNSPTIAMGDYNAKNPLWNSTIKNHRGMVLESYLDRRGLVALAPTSPTISHGSRRPPDWLDIAILRNIRGHPTIYSVPELSSDHYPVLLQFRVRPSAKAVPHSRNPRKTNWRKFTALMANQPAEFLPCQGTEDADNLANFITSTMVAAMTHATPPSRHAYWQNKLLPHDLRQLIADKNKARRRYQLTRSPEHKREWNRLHHIVKMELQDHSNLEWEQRLSTLDTEDSSLWRMSKAILRVPSADPPLTDGTRVAQSPREKVNLLAEHLASTFHPAEPLDADLADEVIDTVRHYITAPFDIQSVKETTTEEVRSIVVSVRPYKAAGNDTLPYAAFKALPTSWLILLVQLYNSLLRLGHFPKAWKHAYIITLPKSGKDHGSVNNYRPISLLPAISKIFEKIIQARLQSTLDQHDVLRPEQFGFRRKHCTTHQLLRIVDQIVNGFNNRHYTVALFLDISKAFDSVWHEGLLHRLINYNIPPYLVHIIHSFLSNRTFAVTRDSIHSSTFLINAGVPQGSVLGPLLFLTYINTLPTLQGCSLYLFADDTAITTSSSNHGIAVQRLQRYSDLLSAWFAMWRLKINATKSQAVTFTRRQLQNTDELRLAGELVPWSTEATYLGVRLDMKLTWKAHIHSLASKINKRMGMLYCLYNRKSPMSLKNKLLIYKMVLRPAMTYACQVWGAAAKSHLYTLQVLQNRYLRIATAADWYIPNDNIHKDISFPTLTEYILQLSHNFYARLPTSFNQLIRGLGEYDIDPGETYKRPRLVLGQ